MLIRKGIKNFLEKFNFLIFYLHFDSKNGAKIATEDTDTLGTGHTEDLVGMVFSAGFACKVNFSANTCLRPLGSKNCLIINNMPTFEMTIHYLI